MMVNQILKKKINLLTKDGQDKVIFRLLSLLSMQEN